ncbi:MAG: hypothetical protein QOD39_3417 [Mycobacterium sp.]|jgi:hypothetical protein|nr:hypothetical protein [Mycobacterium sp.]
MAYNTPTAGRSQSNPTSNPGEFDRTDRILLGACAGIWLAALGAGVAATVALVDLGRGHPESSGASGTPWLLYTVIAVSAVVIIGAVPLLLRARRTAMAEAQPQARPAPRPTPGRQPPPVRGVESPTEKLRISGAGSGGIASRPGYSAPWPHSPSAPAALIAAVDQVWLRCALVIACAIGIAMVAIGVATYLMAVDSDAAAWVFYVLTGIVTLAMPVVPFFYLRELRALLESQPA